MGTWSKEKNLLLEKIDELDYENTQLKDRIKDGEYDMLQLNDKIKLLSQQLDEKDIKL